jgi:adenine specific DNA methylase Mod
MKRKNISEWKNQLFFGDNLDILKNKIADESIDLIYLDPPFKSGEEYNVIFKPERVKGATAQIKAFEDTWRWGEEAEKSYSDLISGEITKEKPNPKFLEFIKAMREYLGECSMMAYLVMMAPRLLELKRVLKKSGSIYLHCDPTASHYLKLLMDAIFGPENFRNEIIWKRTNSTKAQTKGFGRQHDVLLFYSKSQNFTFHKVYTKDIDKKQFRYNDKDGRGPYQTVPLVAAGLQKHEKRKEFEFHGIKAAWLYSKEKLENWWREGKIHKTKSGTYRLKVYLNKLPGKLVSDLWIDKEVPPLQGRSGESLGYPTQKPVALLERIIKASSNDGDLVLDPFCGCGSAIEAAHKLGRRWIGIDISYLAIDIIVKRLRKSGLQEGKDFEINGDPQDEHSARELARKDPFQFQIWCVSKLGAIPSERKSRDEGVDGVIYFIDPSKRDKTGKGIVQVKAGDHVSPAMVRDLKGTIKSQNAEFGILITFGEPTPGMRQEALREGFYEVEGRNIHRIQFLRVKDLFEKRILVDLPPMRHEPYPLPLIRKEASQGILEFDEE